MRLLGSIEPRKIHGEGEVCKFVRRMWRDVVRMRVQSLPMGLSMPGCELERIHGRDASVILLTLVGLFNEVTKLS